MNPEKTTAWQPDGPSRRTNDAKFYDKDGWTKLKWPAEDDPPPRDVQDWRVLATDNAATLAQYSDDEPGDVTVKFEGTIEEFVERTNLYRVYRCVEDG